MQFLWKWMDELLGKGLGALVLGKFVLYTSAHLVLMALPLAVLLSSIMTFGSLSENSELVAMKAAGLSLFRIMRPAIVAMLLLAVGTFFFANNVWPVANLKFKSLLWDITQKKPALTLEENVFYQGLEGYSIRVKEKTENNGLRDVLIYDHSSEDLADNKKVIRAERGRMKKTSNGRYLLLTLFDGVSYDEDVNDKKERRSNHDLIRTTFEQQRLRFDLMGFKLKRTDEDLFKRNNQMLNIDQLWGAIDSMEERYRSKDSSYQVHIKDQLALTPGRDTLTEKTERSDSSSSPFVPFKGLKEEKKTSALSLAIKRIRDFKGHLEENSKDKKKILERLDKHAVEIHRKFTLPLSCLILFFIGAPLGALIKRGGFGLPVIFSVVLFLIYHMLYITGEKMAESGKLAPVTGMWLPVLVLAPLAGFLTFKAARDSQLLDLDSYVRFFRNLTRKSGQG